jgi:two-component system nitrate/nitrite response regulator NarL
MPTSRSGQSPVRVTVVDPRPAYRIRLVEGIRQRRDLELVSEAGDGSSACQQIIELGPDVAVVDLHILGFDGLRVLESIIQKGCDTRVLILSQDHDGPLVYQAIEAGATGCLSTNADLNAICDATAAVARGKDVFAPELINMIANQIRGRRRGGGGKLTERERAILRLTADGLPAGRVAAELAVSESTVKTHLTNAYSKLGVSCAAAAVYEAMRLNILS